MILLGVQRNAMLDRRSWFIWICLAAAICGQSWLREAEARSAPAAIVAQARISDWRPTHLGIEVCRGSTDTPRPLQMHAVRVDLHEPTIRFLVTPSNGKAPKDCNARTTSEFLTEFKCQAAINGSVFSPVTRQPGAPQDVLGLSLSRGDLYSPPNKYDALLIDKDRKAWLDQSPVDASKAYNGLSGFYALLVDGNNVGTMRQLHPRSAVGVSKDNRYLILMTIDGRQKGYSEGATTAETAEWIRKLGAFNALNLDGGGSTTLVIQDAEGRTQRLNRPSGIFERRVANHLGVFAQPLPKPGGRGATSTSPN
jgi:hypothetical protein